MAHIDDLVKKVGDPQLREALAEQVRTLTDRTEFGLTFQRHLPESVRLPEQRIRRGDLVELRDEAKGGPRYRVVTAKAEDQAVAVVALDSAGEPVGAPEGKLRSDLVVVKLFGEPIYPGLRQVGEAGAASPGQPTHVVVAGENFHALQALEYTHEGRVDLIYIDPPYNTGAADWKYNDRYVDSADSYRHSKWLSFMERRLKIAKRLLTPTGVVIMAIGDDEHHRLRMLADQVLGEENFVSNVVWSGGRKNDSRLVSNSADYMLIYAASRSTLRDRGTLWRESKEGVPAILQAGDAAWEGALQEAFEEVSAELASTAGDSEGTSLDALVDALPPRKRFEVRQRASEIATSRFRAWWKSVPKDHPAQGSKHYNFICGDTGRVFFPDNMRAPESRPNRCRTPLTHPLTGQPCKVPPNGWMCEEATLFRLESENKIYFGGDHNRIPNMKRYLDESTSQVPESTFSRDRRIASKQLQEVLGDKRFPNPKDHEILARWFRTIAPKDGVILDFFAGSGTTAEAVIRLNAEDGGTRQCILVTNNELSKAEDAKLRKQGYRPGDADYEALGVFHHVTKPRVSTVLTGLREDGSRFSEGIDGQAAAFFDLTYEDENLVALGRRFEAIAPLLWVKAGAAGAMIEKMDEVGFSAPEDAKYAVIFDTDTAPRAVAALHDGIELVYIVTDSDADFRRTVSTLPRRLQPTAQRLYSTYLRSFEINRG